MGQTRGAPRTWEAQATGTPVRRINQSIHRGDLITGGGSANLNLTCATLVDGYRRRRQVPHPPDGQDSGNEGQHDQSAEISVLDSDRALRSVCLVGVRYSASDGVHEATGKPVRWRQMAAKRGNVSAPYVFVEVCAAAVGPGTRIGGSTHRLPSRWRTIEVGVHESNSGGAAHW